MHRFGPIFGKIAVVALLTMSVLGPALADGAQLYRPTRTMAFATIDGGVLVAWAPGLQVADAYRIYGVSAGGVLILIEEMQAADGPELAATVVGGYAQYGVSGIFGGSESSVTLSQSMVPPRDITASCVEIYASETPPTVALREDCRPPTARVPANEWGTIPGLGNAA